ncbi:hypothetical protein PR202_gb18964 [Eleusine coracana subsp. coracana]|uniref:Uncharacterized protein n=1 Tax=Eleusine coracana subsp. coracana TaxID=191504 RepID=A0AAV5F8D8_ELECO|nr:hypothetical protein PR202_gb18964 [Eleusine coracana subsp. coracana]
MLRPTIINPWIRAQARKQVSGQVQLSMALRFFLTYRDTRRLLATIWMCLLLNPLRLLSGSRALKYPTQK